MKFIVRPGFVVHLTTIKSVGGEKRESTTTYTEGETCNLAEEDALRHAHKLEPADKSAEVFLASLVLPSTRPTAVSAPATADAIAAAVAATLKQLGIVAAKA